MSKKMQLYFDNGQGKMVKYLNNGSNNLKNNVEYFTNRSNS